MRIYTRNLFLFVLLGTANLSMAEFADIVDVLHLGREMVMDVLESWKLISESIPGQEANLQFPFVRRMERELQNRISVLSGQLSQVEYRMSGQLQSMLARLMIQIPMDRRLEMSFREFERYVGQVDDLYESFVLYAKTPEAYEKYTLEDFAKTCVSSNLGELPDVLKNIHRLIVPTPGSIYNTSILTLLVNQMQEASSQMCNEHQSSQQLLYNLYNRIALTEVKGYSMIQFSYIILQMYNKGSNFKEEMNLMKQQYATRTTEGLRAVKTAMAFAPRDLWSCDPRMHRLDETYTEMKQLFQGYIVNEVDLNSESTCRENCAYYSYAKVYGCYQNQFCAEQRRCNGKVINCEYIDSDMWICPADNSSRRYNHIEYENGMVFGPKDTCKKGTKKVDSWWRWLFWHCSYCFCYCDDHNISSDRYFSLRDVVADIANNKVITGIRMKKVNQIIHFQIQEGELLPRGHVNVSTLSWKPIDQFSILDSNVKNGVDYHTLAWEKRGVDLDDLTGPQDHILTGVRFRTLGTRLNLEIMVTPFNYTTGKLIRPLEKSYWHSNDVTDRTELLLTNPDIPIRSLLPNMPDSKINQYVNFAASDRQKDAAQSTVPFIDTQTVVPSPPTVISGAGIYHKGRKGSGGFIGVKLITYNYAPHLQVDLPPPTPVIKFNDIKN